MQLDIATDPSFDPAFPPAGTWKAELKRIVEFLNRDNLDSLKLWIVLSALRGPDTPDPDEIWKVATTAVIRHTIGLRMKGLVILPDSERSLAVRKALPCPDHFSAHTCGAFSNLGLGWDVVNKSAEEVS